MKDEAQEPEMKDEAQEPEEIPGDDEGHEGENERKDDVRGQMFHQEVEELEREKRSRRKHDVMMGRIQRQKGMGDEEE